jgi:hypothetical protein
MKSRKIMCVAGMNVIRNTQDLEQEPAPHPCENANKRSGSVKDCNSLISCVNVKLIRINWY